MPSASIRAHSSMAVKPYGAGEAPGDATSRRGRPPARPLSLAEVTRAAIAIADAEGLDAVSIRRVAAALGAPHMSLYGQIGSKEELLAAMADEVIGELLVPEPLPSDWRQAVAAIARAHFTAFRAHPWVITVFGRRPPPGPNGLAASKQRARTLEGLALPPAEIWHIQAALTDYMLGFSVRFVTGATAADLNEMLAKGGASEDPQLRALVEETRSRTSLEQFEYGLGLLLDGIERRIEELTAPS
jgi:AcrR family transcriptional regulator